MWPTKLNINIEAASDYLERRTLFAYNIMFFTYCIPYFIAINTLASAQNIAHQKPQK